jgi:hypothetical protein
LSDIAGSRNPPDASRLFDGRGAGVSIGSVGIAFAGDWANGLPNGASELAALSGSDGSCKGENRSKLCGAGGIALSQASMGGDAT